jgi:hypothetical protein
MNYEHEIMDVGSQLGSEAAEHIAQRADDFCECERQRIELLNEAQINALNFEGTRLTKRERQVEERMRLAVYSGEARNRKRRAYFYWCAGILLSIASFFFSLIAFGPYRLGWYGVLYCSGIAVAIPFGIEVFLETWKSDRLLKAIVSIVFLSAIAGGALLAAIRGDLLSQQIHESVPAVVIDSESPTPPQPQNSFYDSTRRSLRMLMLLLALAIDLGAGVAVHRALMLNATSIDDPEKLANELEEIQLRLSAIVFEITALRNAPNIFVARFWRDYYRAMLTQTVRKAATKFLAVALCFFLLGAGRASAQEKLNLVIAVDLSASVAVKGHDGESQFNKNIQGVTRLLSTIPVGSKVTIIGITENSFAEPYILLSASVSSDEGYFGERLSAARQTIVLAWQKRAAQLQPSAKSTDILGALLVASEIFRKAQPNHKNALVIYSDMRHATRKLNLEDLAILHVESTLVVMQRQGLLAQLSGVTVYVLGADSSGRDASQWRALNQFWIAYFKEVGARLVDYTQLRDVPTLNP